MTVEFKMLNKQEVDEITKNKSKRGRKSSVDEEMLAQFQEAIEFLSGKSEGFTVDLEGEDMKIVKEHINLAAKKLGVRIKSVVEGNSISIYKR